MLRKVAPDHLHGSDESDSGGEADCELQQEWETAIGQRYGNGLSSFRDSDQTKKNPKAKAKGKSERKRKTVADSRSNHDHDDNMPVQVQDPESGVQEVYIDPSTHRVIAVLNDGWKKPLGSLSNY